MSDPRYSILPARAVFDSRLTAAEIRILAALGSYTDKQGWCWPSQTSLADRVGLSRQSVSAAVQKLQMLGYLAIRPRLVSGRKTGNEYRVLTDQPDDAAERMSAKPDNRADVGSHRNPSCDGIRPEPTSSMSAQADIDKRTTPMNDPNRLGGKSVDRPAGRTAYTPEFEAFWRSWPKRRRDVSDKRAAFTRWQSARAMYEAETIMAAAKRYLSLPDTRKDDFRYCKQAQVFLNGGLEAAVEAVSEARSGQRERWSASANAWVKEEW